MSSKSDVGPSVITQNKIGFHHMPAHSLADVVVEKAAKRLLPDLNLERKAKKAERIGIGVAKRLALVQTDIWAKRGAAGDIYELEPLVVAEETRTRSAIGEAGGRTGSARPLARSSQQGFEMQSLQRLPRRQTIHFLEPNSLCPAAMCPAAMCGRSHLPI